VHDCEADLTDEELLDYNPEQTTSKPLATHECATSRNCRAEKATFLSFYLHIVYVFLKNRGVDLTDEELLEYISEQTTMSKSLADYGEQKSCATTTAKRLADFLGVEMVKDKGLLCRYIVARSPEGAPVSERAIPVAIFETDPGEGKTGRSSFEFALRK
jgi:DNA polymerase elongation subunit (family B)